MSCPLHGANRLRLRHAPATIPPGGEVKRDVRLARSGDGLSQAQNVVGRGQARTGDHDGFIRAPRLRQLHRVFAMTPGGAGKV